MKVLLHCTKWTCHGITTQIKKFVHIATTLKTSHMPHTSFYPSSKGEQYLLFIRPQISLCLFLNFTSVETYRLKYFVSSFLFAQRFISEIHVWFLLICTGVWYSCYMSIRFQFIYPLCC